MTGMQFTTALCKVHQAWRWMVHRSASVPLTSSLVAAAAAGSCWSPALFPDDFALAEDQRRQKSSLLLAEPLTKNGAAGWMLAVEPSKKTTSRTEDRRVRRHFAFMIVDSTIIDSVPLTGRFSPSSSAKGTTAADVMSKYMKCSLSR